MPDFNELKMSMGVRETLIRWQKFAMAIKTEMGFQTCGVPNDSLGLLSGGVADAVKGLTIAEMATAMSRDLLYTGYRNTKAEEPVQIALAYRDDLFVDWRENLQLYAPSADQPLMLVDLVRRQHYVRAGRNQLQRLEGLPSGNLERGKRVALERVRRTALIMPDHLTPGSCHIPAGQPYADHLPIRTGSSVVRLG